VVGVCDRSTATVLSRIISSCSRAAPPTSPPMRSARPKTGHRGEKVTRYHNAYLRCAEMDAESNQLTAWRNAAGGSIADPFRFSLTRWRHRLGEEQLAALVRRACPV
jgi:hypothetical protein